MINMHSRSWGPWRESALHKGDLKYVILDLLKEEPRYGYEIIGILKERSHGFYTPSPGAVYPTLQLLEEMEYVTANQGDGKKVYTVTDEGRRFLEERQQFADGIKRHMKKCWSSEDTAEMRETMAAIGKLARLIGPRFRGMDPDKMRRIREVVTHAQSDVEAILKEQP